MRSCRSAGQWVGSVPWDVGHSKMSSFKTSGANLTRRFDLRYCEGIVTRRARESSAALPGPIAVEKARKTRGAYPIIRSAVWLGALRLLACHYGRLGCEGVVRPRAPSSLSHRLWCSLAQL